MKPVDRMTGSNANFDIKCKLGDIAQPLHTKIFYPLQLVLLLAAYKKPRGSSFFLGGGFYFPFFESLVQYNWYIHRVWGSGGGASGRAMVFCPSEPGSNPGTDLAIFLFSLGVKLYLKRTGHRKCYILFLLLSCFLSFKHGEYNRSSSLLDWIHQMTFKHWSSATMGQDSSWMGDNFGTAGTDGTDLIINAAKRQVDRVESDTRHPPLLVV